MKKFFLFLILTLVSTATLADDWKSYISYHNVTQALPINGKVYALGSGGLFNYVLGDKKVSTYSKATGLSSCDISHMAYCEDLQVILLIYEDYNIDILDIRDSIINLPEYKNSAYSDKTINDLTVKDEKAYLSTNFGIVEINLKKAEFANTYETGFKVHGAVGDEDYIYALGPDGIYVGERNKNLLERKNWVHKSSSYPQKLIPFNDKIYALYAKGLYSFNTENITTQPMLQGSFKYYSSYGADLVIGNDKQIAVMDSEEKFSTLDIDNDFCYLASDGTNLWAARNTNGLQALTFSTDSLGNTELTPLTGGIIPNSPIRNYFSDIHFTPYNKLLIAGGALAYSGQTVYEGTVMAFDKGKWTNFSEDSIAIKTDVVYRNITSVAEDPKDSTHHFASSAIGGLYEFKNAQLVGFYNNDNSPISSIYPKLASYKVYNRLTGAKYDPNGNLWLFNNQVDTIIRVITPENKWVSIYRPEIQGYPTFDHYLFDNRGWVWMSHRRWAGTYQAGIACLNYNKTLSDTSDDNFAFCTTFTDQNGTTIQMGLLYDFSFDREGKLWIGCDHGVYVLEDPTTIFNTKQTFRRPLIPRNDGTNYADYLLDGVPVKCIAVDGANRKWLGTTNNGLYLVSADGLEILEHFTAANSPLLSDCILSLAIRPDNGIVMIGTDKGLMSYRGDATEPTDKLKESNIKVYPNPVRPNYDGKIRITGFTADSDVKITTTSGLLIAQGTSLGGTFVWDGRDKAGDRVATGIYHVIASDAEGKNGIVAKILMVK